MSLIADALKKAQGSQLGRRYVTAKPAGVLPVAGKGGQSGWRASLNSILQGDHRNTESTLGNVGAVKMNRADAAGIPDVHLAKRKLKKLIYGPDHPYARTTE